MLVRQLADIACTERTVGGNTWTSRRLLMRSDGLGFSLHDTLINAGTETVMHYPNHMVAVYCIDGEGTVTDTADGTVYSLRPGTVYALDQHEAHIVQAATDMRMMYAIQHQPTMRGTMTRIEKTGSN